MITSDLRKAWFLRMKSIFVLEALTHSKWKGAVLFIITGVKMLYFKACIVALVICFFHVIVFAWAPPVGSPIAEGVHPRVFLIEEGYKSQQSIGTWRNRF